MDYVALQVKTSYSILSSLNDIKKLVKKASDLGYTSLAITDVNNMFGVIEFYLECHKYNIKPIIGLEIDSNDIHLLLYAKNNLGYVNLIKLATIITERGLEISDLNLYKDNLVMIMPFNYYNQKIYDIYNDKYIGYSDTKEKDKIKDKKIYITDVSYINIDDYKYLDYLLMIKDNKLLGDYELNTHKNKHLLSSEEVAKIIDNNDIININNIVNSCHVKLEYTPDLLPIYDKDINAFDYLTSLCNKGLNKRLNGKVSDIYQERLNYELEVINEMGFCNYFLIVWDYVKYAKFNHILVGPGRGSAAGSLVSYTLGITDIDPIKYNLLFERFLNPERVTMPDIDIDFDGEKRNLVIDYVINKYGDKKVAGIITFNTLAAKQVIRDVSRVMNIKMFLVDEITKKIIGDLVSSYNNNQSLKKLIDSNKELKKMYQIAIHLEGLPRHVSIHAAGIVMSRKNIDEIIPLYKNQDIYVTGYSMNYLESLGLLKMDFLGLSNLNLISNLIDKIREKEKINITFNNIPIDDENALKIFNDVDTSGIFQFESLGMKRFLKKMKITSFEDIIAAIALFRPGPMDNIDTYIKRKEHKEKIDYIHPNLESILKPTYGIIYQEQIMQIAQVLAGYSLGEADILRRAMSKKKESVLIKEKPKFISRSMEKGYSEELANKVYNLILKFANYGFNRSHSVSYAMIASKMAFLKVYFFSYFMCSLLTNAISSQSKTNEYLMEIKRHGILIEKPNINISTTEYIPKTNKIICPLSIIKNVGTIIANEIIKERKNGRYTSFINFMQRNYSSSINKKVIISLIKADCFKEFGYNQNTLIENLDSVINYIELTKDETIIKIEEPEIRIYDELDDKTKMTDELDIFGFYLVNHPVNQYKKTNDINSLLIKDYFNKNIIIILLTSRKKEIITKNNEVMAFITGNDEYGEVSLTLFPKIYQKYNQIKNGDILKITGKVEKRFDKYQIIVDSIELLNNKQ